MKDKKMTAAERFAAMGERLRKDGRLQIEEAKVELSEQIFILMEDKGINEAELARRLGTSRAYVNKVLQGSTNFTVESLVKIGAALDCELKLEFTQNRKSDEFSAADVIYIEVEKPIETPKVIANRFAHENQNVLDFTSFRENKKLKSVADQSGRVRKMEKENAALQIAS